MNNPVGGLGLTTGLLDAAHLGGALRRILTENASNRLLDAYNNARQKIFRERTDPITTANLLRLMSEKPEDERSRSEFFKRLWDPGDLAAKLQVGCADFALTTTSDTKFDTYHEVTWFISVSKPDDWSFERFRHEYKTVHAEMTRQGGPGVRQYIQLSNSDTTVPGTHRPYWDYVTCLTLPNLFITNAVLRDPGYRATAGAHIFCRLDQQGCFAKQVARFSRRGSGEQKNVTRALLFHERLAADDNYSRKWFAQRGKSQSEIAAAGGTVLEYILCEDHTPGNLDYFFADTQFSGGTWNRFKAVEAFDFAGLDDAVSFLGQHYKTLNEDGVQQLTVVIGSRDDIITG